RNDYSSECTISGGKQLKTRVSIEGGYIWSSCFHFTLVSESGFLDPGHNHYRRLISIMPLSALSPVPDFLLWSPSSYYNPTFLLSSDSVFSTKNAPKLQKQFPSMTADRFSEPFVALLPGMNVVPVHVVPKPPDDKLCLVIDHSAGPYSINSLIDRQSIAGVKLDGIKTLGDSIRVFCANHPTDPEAQSLVLWKSDVAAAYRQMPMHPLWQIKQVINIDGQFSIDRCNNFG